MDKQQAFPATGSEEAPSADPSAAHGAPYIVDAVFPFPASVTIERLPRISGEARKLVQVAILLCRPCRPGFNLTPPAEHNLRLLAERCRSLGAGLPREHDEFTPLDDKELAFDRFFGVARSAAPDAFAVGLVWGVIAMLDELGRPHTLIPAESRALASGFYRLAALILPSFVAHPGTDGVEASRQSGQHDALERWRNGHLIFIALTVGLIIAHRKTIAALEADNLAASLAGLDDLRCLYAASAAAMRLTGDMTAADYDRVRNTMMPPRVPDGFSGLFNADHRGLLQLTKRLGTLLAADRPEISWAREEFWLALNDTYTAHRWVCQQLLGETPSLMAGSVQPSARPGHETLEAFARRALHLGGYPIKPAS